MMPSHRSSRARIKLGVRFITLSIALLCVVAYSQLVQRKQQDSLVVEDSNLHSVRARGLVVKPRVASEAEEKSYGEEQSLRFESRHLLGGAGTDNCSQPRESHAGYNGSCSYVLENCMADYDGSLFNYLTFVLCDLVNVQPIAYILLAVWLLLLISLLATTADYFFVPPLEFLSEKLKLPDNISGITLLAIGNGAPDVFTAYSALQQRSDMALLLGALIGASVFISTVVFGSVILVSTVNRKTINVSGFIRDITVYIIVVIVVVAVAIDGNVHIYEAVLFLLLYVLYITIVVALVYLYPWVKRKIKARRASSNMQSSAFSNMETVSLLGDKTKEKEKDERKSKNKTKEDEKKNENEEESTDKKKFELQALTWPRGSHIGVKIQFVVEWPFSLLRWLTCPPCYHDGRWDIARKVFATIFPIPSLMLFLIAFWGWDGFSVMLGGKMPLYGVFLIIGGIATLLLLFLIPYKKPPHLIFQFILGLSAFVFSICWLNIEANEVVSTLETFGLLFDIDSAILGLTVLAVGNSVGDWVADTAVARAGKPAMGVASCFGSPLLNDVLGLGIALTANIASHGGQSFTFDISSPEYNKVKLSWIFLGISLLASAAVMPISKFSPPKAYGVILIYIYVVFMVFSVLDEVGVLPIHLGDT